MNKKTDAVLLQPRTFTPVVVDNTMENQDWLKSPRELLDVYGIDLGTPEGLARAAYLLGKTVEEYRELPIYQRWLREAYGGG